MTATRRSHLPRPPAPLALSHRDFAVLAVLYGLAIVYTSLVLGPEGHRYAPIGIAEAWRKFRAVGFIANGSDQRPDWIANMMMVIPLAYFVNGAFRLRGRAGRNMINAAIAAAICIVFVLTVKYAQLFFPPRTVTLNYIVAQSIGVVLGVFLFHFARRHIHRRILDMYRRGDGLIVVLGGYSILLTAYFLMPFDLALSPDDLLNRLESLTIGIVPGAGHDPAYRAVLVLADMAAAVPVGMFLAVTGRDMTFRAQLARGIAVILPVAVLSLFILSITPYLIFLFSRTAGVAIGVWFMEALKGKDLWKRHYRYAQYVPVAFPAYLVVPALASGLLTDRWLNIDEALRSLEPDQLLPLWSLYMATKAEAARSVVMTLVMFAPVGAMIWFRRGFRARGAGLSAFVAFLLSLAVEFARLIKPGLTPDFTTPFVAATAAALTFRAMPVLWKLFEAEAIRSARHDSYAIELARAGLEIHPAPRRRGGAPVLPPADAPPSPAEGGDPIVSAPEMRDDVLTDIADGLQHDIVGDRSHLE
jgi:hypothetical protein